MFLPLFIALSLFASNPDEAQEGTSKNSCLFEVEGYFGLVAAICSTEADSFVSRWLWRHRKLHGWKAALHEEKPREGPAASCPRAALNELHGAIVSRGNTLPFFTAPLLANLFARNGRGEEALEILAQVESRGPDDWLSGSRKVVEEYRGVLLDELGSGRVHLCHAEQALVLSGESFLQRLEAPLSANVSETPDLPVITGGR